MKKSEEERNLEVIKENKSAFLTKVNHDIRTPLNGITGLLYLMRKSLNNPEKMEGYLDKIETASEELKVQLELLLNLADMVESSINLNDRRIDLHEFAEKENKLASTGENQEKPNGEGQDILCGKKVLVVEDNEINRVIVHEILESWGCEVLQAEDGIEAVRAFKNSSINEIDFILMDIRMPYMNGREAAKKIRSMGRSDAETVVIIALTANTYQSEIDKVKEAGMDGIITKPLHVSALHRIMSVMAKKAGIKI